MTDVLPFLSEGEIQEQGGKWVADVDLSIWPAAEGRETRVGKAYDWIGEADVAAAAELVGRTNRQILIDGTTYKVINAVRHDFLPHIELRLLEVRGG